MATLKDRDHDNRDLRRAPPEDSAMHNRSVKGQIAACDNRFGHQEGLAKLGEKSGYKMTDSNWRRRIVIRAAVAMVVIHGLAIYHVPIGIGNQGARAINRYRICQNVFSILPCKL